MTEFLVIQASRGACVTVVPASSVTVTFRQDGGVTVGDMKDAISPLIGGSLSVTPNFEQAMARALSLMTVVDV